MTALTTISKATILPFARARRGLAAALQRAADAMVRAWRNRRDAAVLATLDERTLADIGLTRGDVRDAFAAPLWEDPTNLLRARALERRLSRHGISLGLEAPLAPPLVPRVP